MVTCKCESIKGDNILSSALEPPATSSTECSSCLLRFAAFGNTSWAFLWALPESGAQGYPGF